MTELLLHGANPYRVHDCVFSEDTQAMVARWRWQWTRWAPRHTRQAWVWVVTACHVQTPH